MAIDPRRVAVQVAQRTLQISGTTQAALQTAYNLGYLGLGGLDGADAPASAIIDAVVASEAKLVDIVAGDKANPYRQYLAGRSDNLIHGADIPILSDEGVRFVGVPSGVKDKASNMPLTEVTIQEIERYHAAGEGRYTGRIRKYKIFGNKLYHTVTRAYIEGCVWSRTAARNRFESGSTALSPLPTAFESIWVAEAISFLVTEGWLQSEASYYGNFANNGIGLIKSRSLDLPTLPTQEATGNPVVN